jgi:heptosyltransferase II
VTGDRTCGEHSEGSDTPRRQLICLKIASRGDLLLAAPTFRALRAHDPHARLSLIVGASCADVAHRLPYFDEVRVIDDARLFSRRLPERLHGAWEILRELRRLAGGWRRVGRRSAAAEVLIFHRDWRYGLLSILAGISRRRGFISPRGTRFLTTAYVPRPREHHVDQYLGMAGFTVDGNHTGPEEDRAASRTSPGRRLAGVWRFADGERERALAKAKTLGFDPAERIWIALGFGGGNNVKTRTGLKAWPLEHYQQLAEVLVGLGYGVLWLGDREDADRLPPGHPGLCLAGRLSVPESAGVLSACSVAVANDTLLLHLAEALDLPTIGIFGPTDPLHYRPRGRHSAFHWIGADLPCSPCHDDGYFPVCAHQHRCMRQLPMERVLASVLEAVGAGFPTGVGEVLP